MKTFGIIGYFHMKQAYLIINQSILIMFFVYIINTKY